MPILAGLLETLNVALVVENPMQKVGRASGL